MEYMTVSVKIGFTADVKIRPWDSTTELFYGTGDVVSYRETEEYFKFINDRNGIYRVEYPILNTPDFILDFSNKNQRNDVAGAGKTDVENHGGPYYIGNFEQKSITYWDKVSTIDINDYVKTIKLSINDIAVFLDASVIDWYVGTLDGRASTEPLIGPVAGASIESGTVTKYYNESGIPLKIENFSTRSDFEYNSYEWSQWTVPVLFPETSALFTSLTDIVDFNSLTAEQVASVSNGINVYDALEGDDRVHLPNQLIEGVTWDYTTPFNGGAGVDTINGGSFADIINGGSDGDFLFGADGNDVLHGNTGEDAIEGGAGADRLYGDENNDWLYGGKGSDELFGGIGNDKFFGGNDADRDLLVGGQGNDELTPGVGLANDVYGDDIGAELGFQRKESGEFDIVRLEGSADDYLFTIADPRSKDLFTLIENIRNSGNSSKIYGVEKVLFSSAVKNNVNLYVGSIVNEAARLMVEVYTESTQQSAVSASGAGRNWHAVEAIELGIAPSSGSGGNGYTLVNGVYESEFTFTRSVFGVPVTLANDAVATVQLGMTGGVRTLMVTFKGSDPPGGNFDLGDWLVDLAGATGTFYEHYKPLVDGIKSFVADPVNAIQQVLVSGHSLGGAMAQHFISDISSLVTTTGKTIAGYTFGSIGGTQDTVNFSKNYLTNFLHVNDVANGLNLVNEGRAGSIVRINSTNVDPVTGHFKEEYAKDVGLLMEYARGLTTSSFSQTEIAKALVGQGWRNGEIQIAIGTESNDTLNLTSKDYYAIGDTLNDVFDLRDLSLVEDTYAGIYNGVAFRTIDGGTGTDTVRLLGVSSEYTVEAVAGGYKVAGKASGKLIATLENVERIEFLDSVRILNDGDVKIQKPKPGETRFKIQAVGDTGGHAVIGNGKITVIGSSKDDLIEAGSGDKTIRAGNGNDYIKVASVGSQSSGMADSGKTSGSSKPDVVLIDGGSGDDVMIGGFGDETYVVDSLGDTISDSGGFDRVLTSIDLTLVNGIESLVLTNGAKEGFGNNASNWIYGTSYRNTLNGAGGNDVLFGGKSADVLNGGAGNDTASYDGAPRGVTASLHDPALNTGEARGDTYQSIENLTGTRHADRLFGDWRANILTGGNGNDTLYGLAGKDTVIGGNGNDTLDGGTGRDYLTGGDGYDSFLFDVAPTRSNLDRITDFNPFQDIILLDDAIFGALDVGHLSEEALAIGRFAQTVNQHLIYDPKNGYLWYDADGSGRGKADLVAILSRGLSITPAEFEIV